VAFSQTRHGTGDVFTLLTTAPGPDVTPIHDRQMIVLERDDWGAWLGLPKPEAVLLRPRRIARRTGQVGRMRAEWTRPC
jgi:putative SOS response-associated peptidase YedK